MKIKNLVILFIIINSLCMNAQQSDIVKTQGIIYPVHQANIGRIAFTSKSIPVSELKETDFLNTYELTNKSDLFITVFMANSITNYLHSLEPGLNAGELVKTQAKI